MALRPLIRRRVSTVCDFGYHRTRGVCYLPSIPNEAIHLRDEIELKKTVRVAILGLPNAGKSTLINAMMGLNICAASRKPHTTLNAQRAFYVHNDTQIILLDTPGIISRSDMKRYKFVEGSDVFTIPDIKTADVIGLIIDTTSFRKMIDPITRSLLSTLPQAAELILILNKIDRLKNKQKLLDIVDVFFHKEPVTGENGKEIKFSHAFMVSALRNDGVQTIVEYIYSVAPNNTELYTGEKSNLDTGTLIQNRVKAALLEHFSYETPYVSTCETQFVHENQIGEVHAIVNINCSSLRHYNIINSNKRALAKLKNDCQKDLTQVFGKTVYVIPQVILKNEKTKNRD